MTQELRFLDVGERRIGYRHRDGAGPTVVLETVKGTIEFETYPEEAPKTVGRVIELGYQHEGKPLLFYRGGYGRYEI